MWLGFFPVRKHNLDDETRSRGVTTQCLQLNSEMLTFAMSLLIHGFPSISFRSILRLTKEYAEAKKKLDDSSLEANKKTFLKAQLPKLETELKATREKVIGLLDEEELDPRGEFYVLAKKLTK